MAADEKWYFTKEQLANTPSRKCGIDADKELSYRQQAANFIQDMGQRLVVTQLCINTAIVYMHRFYVFHSLSQFHRNSIASAALFLAAKVEEQPRKLEHVIKVAHMCLHRDNSALDVRSEAYQSEAHDLVFNENVLLQTLGFDVAIDHPHTHVVRCCHLVKASKDLAQTSYFMASNSLHLTTMCLQYKPTVVACFCIHLACKWSNWEIPQSNEGKSWFWYVDRSVTSELLAQLTAEFLHIFDKCPSRLKKKIMSISERQSPSMHHPSLPNSPFDVEPRRVQAVDDGGPSFQSARPYPVEEDKKKPSSSQPSSSSARPPTDYREYRDKKERERLEREKMTPNSSGTLSQESKHHHTHHHKQPSVSTPLLSTTSSSAPSTMSMSMSGGPGTPVSTKHIAIAQKTTNVHHNSHHHHHNRPDLKLPQKHSNSTAPRDPNRDSSRQRIPTRDYQQPPNYSQHQLNTAANNHVASKDSNTIPGDAAVDPALAMPDINQHSADKTSNNNHHSNRQIPYDKRGYDPRHKMMEHRKDEQKNSQYLNPAPPPKYPEHIRSNDRLSSSRKLPELEQRSEEVRKLIEKPLPIPKPRAEIQKEEYIANMLKQSHHPNKYSQDSKLVHNNSNRSMYPHDLSKQTVVKSSQIQQPQQHHQHHHHHHHHHHQQQQQQQLIHHQPQHSSHMSQMFKDKNGTLVTTAAPTPTTVTTTNQLNPSLSMISDDKLADKRKHDELNTQVPLTKHKSLFSPDKITPPQDITLSQRNKFPSKQKTPPVSTKSIKQEPNQDVLPDINTQSLFSMSPELSNQHLNIKREPEYLRHHNPLQEAGQKVKSEDNFDKKPPRLPDLLNSTQQNVRSDNLKLPELLKPVSFETELHSTLFNNGLDIKPTIKPENDLSPMKSAQGISALLQEPLAPMPSLLQSISNSDEGIFSQVSLDSSQSCQELSSVSTESTAITTTSLSGMKPLMTNSQSQPNMSEMITMEPFVSTVDISAFSAVPIISASQVPTVNLTQPPQPLTVTATDSGPGVVNKKQDNHHKSEKKKKKDKHKHKDKDKEKSKDKHKHKHKDKDKHRDKDKEKDKDGKERKDGSDKRDKHDDTSVATAPIKITIPKDKLNLMDTTSISNDKKKSPQSTGIKIKIPKERLKNKESSSLSASSSSSTTQAPLKIKIRTNASTSVSQDSYNIDSRKREREAESVSQPPAKKFQYSSVAANQPAGQLTQQQLQQQLQQRASNERQNGRHYNTSSNNKDKHSSREHKNSSKLSQSQQLHPT